MTLLGNLGRALARQQPLPHARFQTPGQAARTAPPQAPAQSLPQTPPQQSRPDPAPGGIANPHLVAPALPENYLLSFLDRYDRRPEKSREGGTDGYMHATSLIGDVCLRKAVLLQLHQTPVYETVSGGHRIMWAQGRATEKHIRAGIIETRQGQGIYGKWECSCGYSAHLGERPQEQAICPKCEHPMHTYREPLLTDHVRRIRGNPDLSIFLPRHFLLVTEIKSMTPEQFDGLEEPLADHVTQAATYREMYRASGFKVLDHVAILYGRKQFLWGGVFSRRPVYKEFHVDCTRPQVQENVRLSFEKAETIKRHVDTRTLPPRTACDNADCKRAKKCPVAHLCFNME